jgi:Kef-type K+ transport system membrane component KefB
LAVIHEYKAKGPVTSAILGAAAFDDIITLILFSFSFSVSRAIAGTDELIISKIIYTILYKIIGAVLTGIIVGIIFNKIITWFNLGERKSLIILFLGFLSLTFGTSIYFKFDELFSTLTLGFMIHNFNKKHDKILDITESGMEDLFFLVFFMLSAMCFDFSNFHSQLLLLILAFILIRTFGKYIGMFVGTRVLKMGKSVQKYAFAGLIPQGGIVLGLSLMIQKEPEFEVFSNLLVGVIMGATIIHEFIGPVISRIALNAAGETKKTNQ